MRSYERILLEYSESRRRLGFLEIRGSDDTGHKAPADRRLDCLHGIKFLAESTLRTCSGAGPVGPAKNKHVINSI